LTVDPSADDRRPVSDVRSSRPIRRRQGGTTGEKAQMRRSVSVLLRDPVGLFGEADAIVATGTISTSIATSSCDRVCNDFQWLLSKGRNASLERRLSRRLLSAAYS
jgi:hypothetical protein